MWRYWLRKSHFSTWQWNNCVITMTASNINFHSWVIKLQINQANRGCVVFAISGPGCSASSTQQASMDAAFQVAVWKAFLSNSLAEGIECGALLEFSTMQHKLRLWVPEGFWLPHSSLNWSHLMEKKQWNHSLNRQPGWGCICLNTKLSKITECV